MEPFEDSELVLARFNRLIQEILRGTMNRNCFRPWEIHLLLDIENCSLRDGAKRETIRRYRGRRPGAHRGPRPRLRPSTFTRRDSLTRRVLRYPESVISHPRSSRRNSCPVLVHPGPEPLTSPSG
jgi:hypothetical protein